MRVFLVRCIYDHGFCQNDWHVNFWMVLLFTQKFSKWYYYLWFTHEFLNGGIIYTEIFDLYYYVLRCFSMVLSFYTEISEKKSEWGLVGTHVPAKKFPCVPHSRSQWHSWHRHRQWHGHRHRHKRRHRYRYRHKHRHKCRHRYRHRHNQQQPKDPIPLPSWTDSTQHTKDISSY